jgi:protein-tyrosine phosphatase
VLPGFRNVRLVRQGLYRSAQPNYRLRDQVQRFRPAQVETLRAAGITLVVSANREPVEARSLAALGAAGIRVHRVEVADFHAPTVEQLTAAAAAITATLDRGGSVLVYCGAGRGRTGTVVTAWQLLSGHDPAEALAATTAETPAQREVLARLAVRLGHPDPADG